MIQRPDNDTKSNHKGVTKASLEPCENSFVSSTYCTTMSWVTQSITGVVLAIIVSLFISHFAYAGERAGPSAAHLKGVEKYRYSPGLPAVVDQSHFFDFEFAKKAFENFENFENLDNGYDREYAAWDNKFKRKPIEDALAALDKNKHKIKIMQAHDLQWAYYAWSQMVFQKYGTTKYEAFPGVTNRLVLWRGWNEWDQSFCEAIIKRNIFNDSCVVPDWRTTNQKIFALNQSGSINRTRGKEIKLLESLLKDNTLGEINRQVLQDNLDKLRATE